MNDTSYAMSLAIAFMIGGIVGSFIPGLNWAVGASLGAFVAVFIAVVLIWLLVPPAADNVADKRALKMARALMYLRARRQTLAGNTVVDGQHLVPERSVAGAFSQANFCRSRRSARLEP
jgi:hypothetical protein